MKNNFKVLLLITLFTQIVSAQDYNIDEYEIKVIEVLQKKSLGGHFLLKGEKFVGIEVLLTPKNKKNDGLSLKDLVLKSANEEYKLEFRRPYGFNSIPTTYIKIRKPKKLAICAIVDENFKEGTFYYKGNRMFTVKVEKGKKTGKLIL